MDRSRSARSRTWLCSLKIHFPAISIDSRTSVSIGPSLAGVRFSDRLERGSRYHGVFIGGAAGVCDRCRWARGPLGAQAQNALTRSASRPARSRPAVSACSISAGDSRCTLPGSAAIRSVLVPAASTYLSSCSISFGMLENRGPLSVSATTKARLAPAMRSTWVLVEHMAPSMHSRSPIQVGPKTPGNDALAQTACEIGMLLDCERTRALAGVAIRRRRVKARTRPGASETEDIDHKLEVANRRIARSHGATAD